MISRQQLEQLQTFHNDTFLVTSCYLNLDRTHLSASQLKIRTKDLVRAAVHELQGKAATHLQRESLQLDFEKIENFILEDALVNGQKAVAIFCCAGEKFWQVYRLPRVIRNTLVADATPYLRPLRALLAAYRRFCTVVVDRTHGRFFEVYMGAVVEHTQILDALPRQGREGGYGGREERGMERRHDGAVKQHYQRVADATFALLKQQQFDALVLGGQRDVLGEFKHHLHPYLRQRWVGDLLIEMTRANAVVVLQETMGIEQEVQTVQTVKLAAEILRRAQAGEHAVVGVEATLAAVGKGEAQTLLVEDGFEVPGFVCRPCRWAGVNRERCPQCSQPAETCLDLVDLAVEQAVATGCEVQYLSTVAAQWDAQRMGALLRY